MTYQSTILADSPYVYYRLDEASGATTAANSGSLGGTGTVSSSLVKQQSPAGTIDGYSMSTSAIAGSAITGQSLGASIGNFTCEIWIKRIGTDNKAGMIFRQFNSTSNTTNISLNTATGALLIQDLGGGTVNGGLTSATLIDGNWHHLVITRNSTTNVFTIYIDGVSQGTTTGTMTSRSATLHIGSTSSTSSVAVGIDEPAYYTSILSDAQIKAHYDAGVVAPGYTATPPAINLTNLTVPAPVVRIINNDVTNVVPAASLSLNMAAPVVTAVDSTLITYTATADRSGVANTGTATTVTINGVTTNSNNLNRMYVQFPKPTLISGYRVKTATLRVTTSASGTYTGTSWAARGQSPFTGQADSSTLAFSTVTPPAFANANWVNGGTVDYDITALAQGWADSTYSNNGVILGNASTTANAIAYTSESGNGPQLIVTQEPIPVVVTTVVVPPFTANYSTVAPAAVSTTKSTAIDAPVATLDLSAIDAGVSTQIGVISQAPAISAGSVEFKGGESFNPDYSTTVPAMTLSLTSVNPRQFIEYNAITAAPAIYLGNMENEIATINLTTNRLMVAPVMNLSLKWPGIYVESADRYLTLLNSNSADFVWYKLGGETNGATRIVDSKGTRCDGYVFGTPDFNIPDGPELRKAARFDGIDDYIVTGPYSGLGIYNNQQSIVANDHAVTIEFSIRTTQLNGTVFNATGGGNGAFAAISQTYYAYPNIARKLNLKNGYLHVIDDAQSTKYLTRSGFISDGEWHHIVMSVPALGGPKIPTDQTAGRAYLMVDGKTVLVAYGIVGGEAWTPYAFMADADFQSGAYSNGGGGSGMDGPAPGRGKNVTGYLAGDLRDVIVRLQTYVKELDATSAYYEWSDSTITKAEPMTLSLNTVAPFKARGNFKRMLAVYGLPHGYNGATGMFTGGEPINAYMSKFSAFTIRSFDSGYGGLVEYDRTGWHRTGNMGSFEWQIPQVFPVGDFMVYPVGIRGGTNGTMPGDMAGVPSAPGLLNPDSETDSYGKFVDYETGQPRFIDLQNDLTEPVENFDAITVVNYPWVAPNGFPVHETSWIVPWTASQQGDEFGLYQKVGDMQDSAWEVARDNFRDSILEAVYNGVNLWIGEYHMAQHLGFIGVVDIHDVGSRMLGYYGTDDFGNYVTNDLGTNIRAEEVDKARLNMPWSWNRAGGGYCGYPQINHWRRITAEVPGLTDIPSNYISEMVEGWNENEWLPNGSFLAFDIARRPNGLQVGDRMWMDVFFRTFTKFDSQTESQELTQFDPAKRRQIVSARPEGIVGRVISREGDVYYGPATDQTGNYRVISNPFKDNAYTIAAERGSVVRGRPIRGRVFIELMDYDARTGGVSEDLDKKLWGGEYSEYNSLGQKNPSKWDFDTRRYKEVKITSTSSSFKFIDGALQQENKSWSYMTYETGQYRSWNTLTMHMRGLRWLALTPDVSGDDYVAYAAPITVVLSSPAPAFSNTKNPAVQVNGAMRLDLEVRQPANYRDGSVLERAFPMEMSLDMRGIGRTIQVPPMELTVSMVAPVIDAETEIITLYMDNTNTITLFLKEDN